MNQGPCHNRSNQCRLNLHAQEGANSGSGSPAGCTPQGFQSSGSCSHCRTPWYCTAKRSLGRTSRCRWEDCRSKPPSRHFVAQWEQVRKCLQHRLRWAYPESHSNCTDDKRPSTQAVQRHGCHPSICRLRPDQRRLARQQGRQAAPPPACPCSVPHKRLTCLWRSQRSCFPMSSWARPTYQSSGRSRTTDRHCRQCTGRHCLLPYWRSRRQQG